MREESKVIDAIHDLVLKHTDLNVWVTTGTLRSTRVTKASRGGGTRAASSVRQKF